MDLIEDTWRRRVDLHGDDPFIIDSTGAVSVAAFDERARAIASALAAAGVQPGALVATMTELSPDALALGMALQVQHLVQVPLLVGLTAFEEDGLLGHCRSRWLVTAADSVRDRGCVVAQVYPGHVLVDLGEEVQDRAEEDRLRGLDAGWIVYTSGSSGVQKGVVLPRASLTECGVAFSTRYGLDETTRILMCFPMAHVLGTHAVPGIALASGGSIGLSEGFSVSRFWDDVSSLGINSAILFPSQLTLIAAAANPYQAPFRFTITHEYSRRFAERYPEVRQATVWGMTETGAVCCGTTDERITSEVDLIGPPMLPEVRVKIVDDGTEVEPGGIGEICFSYPKAQMIEYYREPEITGETLVDGWVRTGDLGTFSDGELRFRGRLKNVIKRSGETISGDEIERALLEHPAVRECAVAAVPDDVRTEEVGVVVVLQRADTDAQALATYCSTRLADWKVPRYWMLRGDDLPRLPNEKIDVQRVKAMLADRSAERADLRSR